MSRAENEELDLEETQKVPGFIQSPSGNFAPLFGTFYNLLWGGKDIVLQAITGRTSLFLCEVKNGRKKRDFKQEWVQPAVQKGRKSTTKPKKSGKANFLPWRSRVRRCWDWASPPRHLRRTVKQMILQSSRCEIGYPRAWVLGAPSIGILWCESLSP